MIKVKYILIFVFIYTNINIYAQNAEDSCDVWRDRLDQVVDLDKGIQYSKRVLLEVNPECRVRIYSEIAELFFRKLEIDSSLLYHKKAIEYAKKIKANEALSDAYNSKISVLIRKEAYTEIKQLLKLSRKLLLPYPNSKSWIRYYEQNAYISFVTADYYLAIDYMDSTIIAAKQSGYEELVHETYDHLGYCYYKLGNYEDSAKNFIKALEIKEREGYLKDIGGTYRNLGKAYLELQYYDKAKDLFRKAISFTRKQDHQLSLMNNYQKLSRCYRFLGENEKAKKALDSSEILAKKNVDISFRTLLLIEKGILYFENFKDNKKAEEYFNLAYASAKKSKDKELLFESVKSLIDLYFVKEDYLSIYKLIEELETIKKDLNSIKYEIYFLKIYVQYYERTNQYEKSLIALKKYHSLKDSIASKEVFAKVADLEKKYDTKKKELAIATLNKEKDEQKHITKQAQAQQNLYLLVTSFLLLLLGVGAWAFRKLRKQQKELVSTNQVKNRLFSIIAHDLRGMIIPFQRSGKILKYHIEKGNHEKTIELSQSLEQNSESLSNMLDNLLNWSLEQMNGYKMNSQTISINEELTEIISSYNQQAIYKKTNIELKYEKDFSVNFDKGAFHVIFRNLIGNALKYTEEGNIWIEFKNENDLFLCSVIDTGIGISKSKLENIFNLEERKSTKGTRGEKGTGLGLNLAYRFIKMHNGTINVSSEKRIGTRFDLNFPLTKYNLYKKTDNTVIST